MAIYGCSGPRRDDRPLRRARAPGSVFWLAHVAGTPVSICNLSSRAMYSRMYSQATVADHVLPWISAGAHVPRADSASTAAGGPPGGTWAVAFPGQRD